MLQRAPCSRCEDRKAVFSPKLNKLIACPQCSRPVKMRPPGEVREVLSAIEARRIARAERVVAAAVELALRDKRNPKLITKPRARLVDGIMQRWAVGHGSGLPVEDPGALQARPPALDDATQVAIDDIITHALPDNARKFVCEWYRSKTPCPVMAKQRRMSERNLYRHWELVLEFLHGLFLTSKHPDLVRIAKAAGV